MGETPVLRENEYAMNTGEAPVPRLNIELELLAG
jgi:hypothetical protein